MTRFWRAMARLALRGNGWPGKVTDYVIERALRRLYDPKPRHYDDI